jgi:formate/nitrite transporter FocA (FNT family)
MIKSAAQIFLISILGGMSISFGGAVFINVPNVVLGSFLFSLGLFLVCHFRWGLYTGRVQNLLDVSIPIKKTIPDLINVYLGNLLGALFVGYLIHFFGKPEAILNVQKLVQYKLSLPFLNVLVLSFFCGIMVYVAVIGFRKIEDPVGRHLVIVLPVMVFIVSGYEHSIADLFYISAANAWGITAVMFSVAAAIGNLLGGCFIPVFDRLCNWLK